MAVYIVDKRAHDFLFILQTVQVYSNLDCSYATWLISKRTMLIQFVNNWKKEIPWTSTLLDEAVGRPSLIWLENQLDLFLSCKTSQFMFLVFSRSKVIFCASWKVQPTFFKFVVFVIRVPSSPSLTILVPLWFIIFPFCYSVIHCCVNLSIGS